MLKKKYNFVYILFINTPFGKVHFEIIFLKKPIPTNSQYCALHIRYIYIVVADKLTFTESKKRGILRYS